MGAMDGGKGDYTEKVLTRLLDSRLLTVGKERIRKVEGSSGCYGVGTGGS